MTGEERAKEVTRVAERTSDRKGGYERARDLIGRRTTGRRIGEGKGKVIKEKKKYNYYT